MNAQLYPHLFQPLKIKGLTFKNRIMSAPNMLFRTLDGRPDSYYIRYLEHKARGGAAQVTLGEIPVCDGACHTPGSKLDRYNLTLFSEMAAAIHESGAVASAELTHGGMNARGEYNTVPLLGPDDCVNRMGEQVHAMTRADMEHVADAFADAAAYMYDAGFDTVLVHMAHGWIFNQFMSPYTNHRTDEFGGSFENRMRFPLMVLRRIRERVGEGRVIQARVSGSERDPQGFTVDDVITFLAEAQQYVDMVEISVENLINNFACTYMPWGQNTDLSAAIKRSGKVQIPVFVLGSILSPEFAEEVIASGKADGVSMSRALIADPYLPEKALSGRADEIRPCLRCLNCTDSDNLSRHFICSVNPRTSREERLGFDEGQDVAPYRKKVLVVGGGPAGMQAAITAAERGHEVVLCEKEGALGGLLRFTDADSLKHDLRRFKDYLIRTVERLNIRVLLHTAVSDALLETVRPDDIIVATGSEPIVPNIKGIEKAHHATAAYFGPDCVQGETVVIIGGGLVGIETGLHLANLGKTVTVLEQEERCARDAKMVYGIGLMHQVAQRGLHIITSARCTEVTDEGLVYVQDGQTHALQADAVLYAVGMRPNEQPYFDLYGKATRIAEAGDCKQVGKVDGAVHSGYFAGMAVGRVR